MTLRFDDYLSAKLEDVDFAAAFQALETRFAVARQIIDLRQRLGLTQADLAARTGTRQSGISRLENATSLPTLSFLSRVADALDADIEVRLVLRERL